LEGFFSVPPTEWIHLARLLKIRRLNKGEYYFKQGDPVNEVGFVTKGLLYNFYTNSDGDEYVKYFVREHGFLGCYSSLIQGTPAVFSSQTLEPTILFTMRYDDLKNLFQRHAHWERLGRIMAERLYIEKEVREHDFLMSNAKCRYEGFLKSHSDLAQRIPQYLIASFIGISPVSLSRIRGGR